MATTEIGIAASPAGRRRIEAHQEERAPLAGEPIYTELAAVWRSNGRIVPGQQDDQWSRLVALEPYPVDQQDSQ